MWLIPLILAAACWWLGGCHPNNDTIAAETRNFDARAYIQLNPDLIASGVATEQSALQHFINYGLREGRLSPKTLPDQGLDETLHKLASFLETMERRQVPLTGRSLVVFHVGRVDARNSLDIVLNNIRIFHAAARSDSSSGIFYLYNVIDTENLLLREINASASNTGLCLWSASPSDMYTHLRTMSLFNSTLRSFGSLFFMNNGVRGPLLLRSAGQWIEPFRRLLFNDHVGIVGPVLSCEFAPHIQTHFFGIRSALAEVLVQEYSVFRSFKTWHAIVRYYEIATTEAVQRAGYNISSLLYSKRLRQPYFKRRCLAPAKISNDRTDNNPSRWCHIAEEEVIFQKWGGEMLRTNGFVCEATKDRMKLSLLRMANDMPSLGLEVPENLRGGSQVDLFKQYEQEMFRETLLSVRKRKKKKYHDKVCLLVRTSKWNDPPSTLPLLERDVFRGFGHFIRCKPPPLVPCACVLCALTVLPALLRQTDNHWEAFFTVIDDESFANLQSILAAYNDSRLAVLPIEEAHRRPVSAQSLAVPPSPLCSLCCLQYTAVDPGYTATDAAMAKLLKHKDCRWISVTDVGNIYGTEVIKRVRTAGSAHDMVMVPINSKNFMQQDDEKRNLIRWNQMCMALTTQLEVSLLAYTAQPRPVVGKVDLAGVFYDRIKLSGENLFFSKRPRPLLSVCCGLIAIAGNFSNPLRYPCTGCQGGYLTEFLATNRQWTYLRLPIDGMKSIVFHSPAPVWCAAAGWVWFSHPIGHKNKCFSQRTVNAIRQMDAPRANYSQMFDWYAFEKADRVCLRLSPNQFNKEIRGGGAAAF